MDFLKIFLLSLIFAYTAAPAPAQLPGDSLVQKIRKRWNGQLPPKSPFPPSEKDSVTTNVSTSYAEDLRLEAEDSVPPPPTSVDNLKARFDPLKVDSLNDPRLTAMSTAQIQERLKQLRALQPEAQRAYKYAVAYYAKGEKMEKVEHVVRGIRSSAALYTNYLNIREEEKARKLTHKLKGLSVEKVYDFETETFRDTAWLDEIKQRIFRSGQQPDIQTHAIGLLMPNIREFGIEPRQGAVGHRISLDQDYNLLILNLQNGGTKAILWYSTPVWGSSRVEAVY